MPVSGPTPLESGGPPAAAPPERARRSTRWVLLAVLIVAAALRLSALTSVPPGLNQDAAIDAWDAWCLWHTGHDHTGTAWPILYTRGLGANRPALQLYCLIPFQLLGGLNVWTTRLPQAVGGILTVLLLYWIATRLVNRETGLVAAALLALNPWHIQLCRWGHQAGMSLFLVCLPVAALLWAGLPLGTNATRPRWWRALLAGLLLGAVCYGYFPVRLFIPLFLMASALVTAPMWWKLLRAREGALAVAGLVLGVAVTFGPLLYTHLAHPEQIARRADSIWLWNASDSTGARVAKVLQRWAAHYGPDFLFTRGDPYEVTSAAGFGQYHWYLAPLLLLGLGVTLSTAHRSAAARVLLLWLLLYPAGDCLNEHSIRAMDGTFHVGLHGLRSAPGLAGPILLAAIGAVAAFRWLQRRRHQVALGLAGVFALIVLASSARFLTYYFKEYPRRVAVYHGYQADLVEALEWLKPRLNDTDAVFITTQRMNMPYIVSLVVLGWDARQWFNDEREFVVPTGAVWENYYHVGKLYFTYTRQSLEPLNALRHNDRPDRIVLIVRPGETPLPDPVHTVRTPDGTVVLEIHEVTL